MSDTHTVEERIEAGVAWLDSHLGTAWPWYVDPNMIALDSACNCVLGQLAPEVVGDTGDMTDFYSFVNDLPFRGDRVQADLRLTSQEATDLGFYDDHLIHLLTDPWVAKVKELRQERRDEMDGPLTVRVEA